MTLLNPCIRAIGPKSAKIALIGEAPGEQEELAGIPFVGPSGQKLDDMLEVVGLHRRDLFLTNLLFTRPPFNKLDAFLVPKRLLPSNYHLPPVRQGQYLHPDLLPELDRLYSSLLSLRPNLIITAGGPATWSLLGSIKITQIRGTIHDSPYGKVLPTLHPATVLYDWSNRPVIISDLMKAKVESEFPQIIRPQRFVLINPTLSEVREFFSQGTFSLLSVDIETKQRTITSIGFAFSKSKALVVPFYDERTPNRSYWSKSEEFEVRKIISAVLSSPVPKLFQNGLYDIQYLLREGYPLRNCLHDTMILHHAMYPELPKSLGFMGSVYTNEASWKLMRSREDEDFKREEE